MAVKLILTQIMKNESLVVERMLNSLIGFVDGVVMIDTGSTDNSIELVEKWGKDNNIETHVIVRPFDDFEQSRNFSIDKAREIFLSKNDKNDYYSFWLDCDEVLQIDKTKFNKNSINRDLYMFSTTMGNMAYTRNEMFRLSKPVRFYGVLHEYLVCDDKTITTGHLEGVTVFVRSDGASWRSGNIADKYKKHAALLEDYIDNRDRDPRWVFYTAQSYFDSANLLDNKSENDDRWNRAIKYYKERVANKGGYFEERYYSQFRIGVCRKNREESWKDVMEEFLKAYAIDPTRVEPYKEIIEYYMQVSEWGLAYAFSKYAKIMHHGKNPYPNRVLFIEPALYAWKILQYHAYTSHYTGRLDEAKQCYSELMDILRKNPELFTPEDIAKINANSVHFV